MQTAEQRLVERKEMRKAKRRAKHKARRKARHKAKAFVKKVNELQDARKRAGTQEPGWSLDDTDLACEAFELAYALADVETVEG